MLVIFRPYFTRGIAKKCCNFSKKNWPNTNFKHKRQSSNYFCSLCSNGKIQTLMKSLKYVIKMVNHLFVKFVKF